MTRKAVVVSQHMTHLPVESELCETVADAEALMSAHRIGHLPVMSGSHLKGIVSRQGLLALRVRHGGSLDRMLLEDVCEQDVLKVSPVTPVADVAEMMLARRVGSAVVVDGQYVVGIFTTTDALRLLRELLS